MKFDVNRVLDGISDSLVVRDSVDLTFVRHHGRNPFTAPVALTAQAQVRDGVVTLDCAYTYRLELVCDRCLTSFTKEGSLRSSHVVVRELNGPDSGEFVVAPDGIVQLDELATNDIIPELPSKVLCRETCKGLCPVCGCNRNETDCGCRVKETDPRLEVLNKLLEN